MSVIDDLTVEDFKKLFARNFPYLPIWDSTKVYFKGDRVYAEPNFYESLIDNNSLPVTDTEAWLPYQDSINNYVLDSDIQRAWVEAKASFNISLGGNKETTQLMFLYLVAFYLSYDLQLAAGGAYGQIIFPVTSATAGSVSESYYVPKVFLEDPVLAFYARNGFGLKYLNMIYPKLVGNVSVVAGWSLP